MNIRLEEKAMKSEEFKMQAPNLIDWGNRTMVSTQCYFIFWPDDNQY